MWQFEFSTQSLTGFNNLKSFSMKTIKLPFANAKIAFINGNRSVNGKRLLESIKKYGILRPIDIIPYGEIKNQNITLTDVHTGNVIENPSDDYFVVLDGQHRLSCVLQLFNEHRESQVGNCDEGGRSDDSINSNLYNACDLKGLHPLTYISIANSTPKCWSANDFIDSAYVRNGNDLIIKTVYTLKSLGFSNSNISRVLFFDHKAMKPSALSDYVDGNNDLGSDMQRERGLEVLRLLVDKGFSMNFLKKRYMMEAIIKSCTSGHLDVFLTEISYISKDVITTIEKVMTPTNYDNGDIKKKIDACYKQATQGQEIRPFVIDSSEDRFKENLSFFQAMVSEITNKKNKSKSHTKTHAKNLDVKLEDIQ